MPLTKRAFLHRTFFMAILIVVAVLIPTRSGAGRLETGETSEKLKDIGHARKSSTPAAGAGTSLISLDANAENGPLSILASSCLAGGTLSAIDNSYHRVTTVSTGTGFGSCTLSGTATAVRYDTYQFTLTGCASFPSQVTISLCPAGVGGSGGCATFGSTTDTVLNVYRSGASLTAGTGTAGAFNPANACTNLVALNDDLGAGTATSPGGSSCDGATCHPACTGSTSTSGMFRSLGPGFFSVVVAGFANSTVGNYNLFVNAPGAGCSLVNSPTASDGGVRGRITDVTGNPIAGAIVKLNGTQDRKFITDTDGSYRFDEVETNGFYTLRPSHANYTFSPAERSFNQLGNTTEATFTGEPDITSAANIIDSPEYFVRQHYLDSWDGNPTKLASTSGAIKYLVVVLMQHASRDEPLT
jgi:hypothetical protein